MKNPLFLPVEKREPVEDYDDEFLESYEDEFYEMLSTEGKGKPSIKKLHLYIAS